MLVEGPSKRDDTRWSGRTTQNKLVHFEKVDGIAVGRLCRRTRSRTAAATTCIGEIVRCDRGPAAQDPHPGCRCSNRHVVLLGPTGSGKSSLAMAHRAARDPEFEIVSVDAMCVYRGMDIGTAKPSLGRSGAGRAPPRRRRRSGRGLLAHAVPGRLRRGGARHRGARPAGAAGGRHRAVRARRGRRARRPAAVPRRRAELEAEPGHRGAARAARRARPAGRHEDGTQQPAPRSCARWRCASAVGPAVLELRARARRVRPRRRSAQIGLWPSRDALGDADRGAFRRPCSTHGFLDEVRALARLAGVSRTARQALGYRQLLDHVESGRPLDECVAEAVARSPSSSPAANACGSAAIRGLRGSTRDIDVATHRPSARLVSVSLRLTKHEGWGNDFLVLADEADATPVTPELARRVCDRRFGIGADGLLHLRRPEQADLGMALHNADGSPAEMSGNGLRCLVQAALRLGWVERTVGLGSHWRGPAHRLRCRRLRSVGGQPPDPRRHGPGGRSRAPTTTTCCSTSATRTGSAACPTPTGTTCTRRARSIATSTSRSSRRVPAATR